MYLQHTYPDNLHKLRCVGNWSYMYEYVNVEYVCMPSVPNNFCSWFVALHVDWLACVGCNDVPPNLPDLPPHTNTSLTRLADHTLSWSRDSSQISPPVLASRSLQWHCCRRQIAASKPLFLFQPVPPFRVTPTCTCAVNLTLYEFVTFVITFRT